MFKKKAVTIALSCIAVAVIGVAGIYILRTSQTRHTGLELDPNATIGIMPGIDPEARKAELQQTLDNSKIAFSVNASPHFDKKTREGNLLLENPQNNAKMLVAQLVLDGSNEVIYSSKALVPGSYLEKITLDKALTDGIHNATLYLEAYDLETQEIIGKTGAAVSLTVS